MKIKTILSLSLILLTLLCSTKDFSHISVNTSTEQTDVELQYIESDQDVSQDFRESIKISLSEQTESENDFVGNVFSNVILACTSIKKYQGFSKAYLFNTPSKKLFIDFRSIII